ncbi:3-oxoacyl-(acyl carrier protein) synthase [Enhygromyxa salina]|uniref:3-oxoacyl-(Acyl carrier protein) synthase n=1 Tax=Enhygromyxa salina TaxID=215803 RepID=A0A2S9YL96_9BACT|nr:hypothetical protein [Enhygromyxa salina]PRQ05887.1 3-oxoacyl-(acyl carrier protein) synthase [Enhygromyxa salina]
MPAAQRVIELLVCALAQSARQLETTVFDRCVLVCSNAPTRRVRADLDPLAQLILDRSGVQLRSLELICGDETSCAVVLSRLRAELEPGDEPVLLCAVDSLVDIHTMAQANLHKRLRTETNGDGFIPGEAAACVLVTTSPSPTASRVAGLGVAHEPATILDTRPHDARGMTNAARAALAEAGWRFADLDLWLADLGGEQYEFNEIALCCARLPTERCPSIALWHPSEYFGSVGVAAGPAAWMLATQASRGGWAPGRRLLCSSTAAAGARSIVLLEAPTAEPPSERLDPVPRWAW